MQNLLANYFARRGFLDGWPDPFRRHARSWMRDMATEFHGKLLTYYLALILGVHAAWSLIFALAWQTLRWNAVLLMPILNYIQCIRFS